MNTPICDFVRRYADGEPLRFHMPGHKGRGPLGAERLDITEIPGADTLYEAAGVIAESERNASALFGADTYYSAEGASLCIRAMLYLALLWAKEDGRALRIAAGRNAHRTFLSALALLDMDVDWLLPEGGSYLSCPVTAADVERYLKNAPVPPAGVYLTDPDYLGGRTELAAAAAVCRRYGVPLLTDGAHGAYLKFLPGGGHPADAGASLCCSSAHKTLPVLTGGAWLHLGADVPDTIRARAKDALALFGSTSPSYLILQSLDAVNLRLAGDYPARLAETAAAVSALREDLAAAGYGTAGDEPLKLTLRPRSYGYTGRELARLLEARNIWCEFADPDHIVFLFTPENDPGQLETLGSALRSIPRRPALPGGPPLLARPERVLPVREAVFAPSELLPPERCLGRIQGQAAAACPPAVPIVMPGERIDAAALEALRYYGAERCQVLRI